MNIIWLIIIGGVASMVVHKATTKRCYSAFDDFLWGTLGAFYGDTFCSILDPAGSFPAFVAAVSGAAVLLWVTGIFTDDRRAQHDSGASVQSVFNTMPGERKRFSETTVETQINHDRVESPRRGSGFDVTEELTEYSINQTT